MGSIGESILSSLLASGKLLLLCGTCLNSGTANTVSTNYSYMIPELKYTSASTYLGSIHLTSPASTAFQELKVESAERPLDMKSRHMRLIKRVSRCSKVRNSSHASVPRG